jgi:FKBP-type peptidyl-prolyl cis-trans isomerase FklB
MRKNNWLLGLSLATLALTGCNKLSLPGSGELKTQKDKVSYGIGLDIGRSFKQQSLDAQDLDLSKVMTGIQDMMNGKKPLLSEQELNQAMVVFQQEMMARHDSIGQKKGQENLVAGTAFLEKNAQEPGVVTLPDGLQYKIEKAGNGKKPDSNSTVTVQYRGTLIDGTEFDSSIARGQPATFPLKGVIKGWTEALQLMPVGSKWMIYLPPSLAYGPTGAGDKVGPNSTLIFEVELLSVSP